MSPPRLHTKFLVLVLGSLIIFLGTIAAYFIDREARLLERKAEEKQHVLALTIYADLKESMVQGTPQSTVRLMDSIRGTYDLVRLDVVRKDGRPAFGVKREPLTLPQLAEVFATGAEQSFLQEEGEPVHTILYPLRNEAVCRSCHRNGEPILGVLALSLSWRDSLAETAESRRTLIVFFAVLIVLIGLVLYALVRRVVLGPIAALHDGAERMGRGELGHRVSLDTKDEMQELAQSLNAMAGRLEASRGKLELMVRERTAEAEEKARRLYEYSRDMATISRLSTRVFNAEQPLDDMLDRFQWAVSRGLGYQRSLIGLIDRKHARLEFRRDSGLGQAVALTDLLLSGDDPLAALVRSGRELHVPDASADPVFGGFVTDRSAPLSLLVMPIRTSSRQRRCWEIKSCVRTDCPAHVRDEPCWLIADTLCGNALMETYRDKLAFCMMCEVFPVLGVLIVAARVQSGSFRRRDVNVLRILALEMGAALENHLLHEDNRHLVRDLLELHNVTAAALADLSLERAMESFIDSAMKFTGLDACHFWLLSDDGRSFLHKAGAGPEHLARGAYPLRLPVDRGVLGRAFSENRPVAEYDLPSDPTELGSSLLGMELPVVLVLPLQASLRPLGVFTVHKKGTMPFLEREAVAFMLLANHAAMAMSVCMLNAELKSQNRELAANIGLLRGILASLSSGVLLLDPDGTIRMVNEAGAELLHLRPAEMMGRRVTDLFPESQAFLTASPGLYQEVEIVRRSNSRVSLGFSTARSTGEDGTERTIVVCRDLTEIKSLQAAVLTKERFAAMGQVVAGVAHEIRNPLFGISSVGQILERELRDTGQLELIRALLSETRRLNELVEELLIYGKPVNLSLAECDLSALWSEVISMHREELDQKGIRISSDLAQTRAYVDANQMRQVFLNLFRNAVDATPQGGAISIRLLLEDRNMIFTVSDTGTGIPAHQLSKVFDLFFTTKARGTGLGLGICKKIIEDHGGVITLASRQEDGPAGMRGTTATIRIPYRVTVQVSPAL